MLQVFLFEMFSDQSNFNLKLYQTPFQMETINKLSTCCISEMVCNWTQVVNYFLNESSVEFFIRT